MSERLLAGWYVISAWEQWSGLETAMWRYPTFDMAIAKASEWSRQAWGLTYTVVEVTG